MTGTAPGKVTWKKVVTALAPSVLHSVTWS
jgi:hypothetical protein